ncbi:plasmid SOS inhibition protein A [Yersinia enterocolitica]
MIPNHLALISTNVYQQAAIHAMAIVERKKIQGHRLAEFPYAKAFFLMLNEGRTKILARDIRLVASNYCPQIRGGEPMQRYMQALDRLIESGGQYCPLPLPDDTPNKLFPSYAVLCRERRDRKWLMQFERKERNKAKQKKQKRRRYQCLEAQAEIELAFITPSELAAWYKRQERRGIDDDDLVDMVQAWGRQFVNLRCEPFFMGNPMWSIVREMREELESRTFVEQWLDSLMLSNKLENSAGGKVKFGGSANGE